MLRSLAIILTASLLPTSAVVSPAKAAQPTATNYASCVELLDKFPRGVARSKKARNKAVRQGFERPIVRKAVYLANRNRLDEDRNGVLCEQRKFDTVRISGTTDNGAWINSEPFTMPEGRYRVTAEVTVGTAPVTFDNVVRESSAICDYIFDRVNVSNGRFDRYFSLSDVQTPQWEMTDYVTSFDVYSGETFFVRAMAGRGNWAHIDGAFPCPWTLTIEKVG